MRFHSLKLRGISEAFRNDVIVNFDALGPGLIGIVGENGAGKSTLIGSLFASLYRQLPGQKRPLYDFATHAEPEIDAWFSINGEKYRSLVKINPQSRQMESYLFRADGTAISDGKKESFQEAIQRLVGSRSLYEASIFSNQKRAGNFLSLERAQRKEVFVSQLLGLERLRRLSGMAKGEAEEHIRQQTCLESQKKVFLSVLNQQADASEIGSLDRSLEETQAAFGSAEQQRVAVTDELGKLQKELGAFTSLEANRTGVVRRRDSVMMEISVLKRAIVEDEHILARSADVKDAREKLAAIATRIGTLHSKIEKTQVLETANRQVESALNVVAAELTTKRSELLRARTECEELSQVPCQGRGEFEHCPFSARSVRGISCHCSKGQLPRLRWSRRYTRAV